MDLHRRVNDKSRNRSALKRFPRAARNRAGPLKYWIREGFGGAPQFDLGDLPKISNPN